MDIGSAAQGFEPPSTMEDPGETPDEYETAAVESETAFVDPDLGGRAAAICTAPAAMRCSWKR